MSKFLLGVLLWCSLIFSGAVSADPIGSPAADFSAQTLGGQAFQLSALKGQPILLKIGTTWCPSCRTQAKTIDKVRPFLVENGVRLVDVFIGLAGIKRQTRSFWITALLTSSITFT